ncbi:hypothetical protein Tco_1277084, partial [Tanacetum coccineum]
MRLGVVVSEDRVVQAANRIGCGVLKALFAYLGSKVEGNMSRIKSWDEIVDKMIQVVYKSIWRNISPGGGNMKIKDSGVEQESVDDLMTYVEVLFLVSRLIGGMNADGSGRVP